MILFISLAAGGTVIVFVFLIALIVRRGRRDHGNGTHPGTGDVRENRQYLDPLPLLLRLLWPAVNLVARIIASRISPAWLARVDQQMRLTHLIFLMSAHQFISLRIVSALLFLSIASAALASADHVSIAALLLFAALGYACPALWMRDIRRARIHAIQKQLPIYLDFLTLAVEAGLNINGAIQKAVEKGPDGPLRRELEHVMRDLKSGLSRSDALRRFAQRQDIKEVSNFVSAVIQAERMGAGLASTLRFQSEQRRSERFQRAEKQAMEAPVKLVFPLIVFIFPVTFIVIAFPIAMRFMQGGFL